MDNINSELVDIVFIDNTMIITYDKCAQTEPLIVGKETYDKIMTQYEHLYPSEIEYIWAFNRYFWEAHPILPEISSNYMK